jgi:hypothetical protein
MLHAIWRQARGPFHTLDCGDKHDWERYDAHKAGCLRCGIEHECSPHLIDSVCPLAHLDDGSVCCTITGFVTPNVRYGKNEYVDHAVRPEEKAATIQPDIFDEVLGIVQWFLSGAVSVACKQDEVSRTLARCHSLTIKILKQHKMDTSKQPQSQLPCLPVILADTLHALRPRQCSRATAHLCHFCADHITKCLLNLRLGGVPGKRVGLVVGLLYLMKQGLTIQNVQWLPRVPSLQQCLPHETCLEKMFKLSMKLVCETENEIKLALRQRVKML